jgi:ABC-type multidrug transport system fused ATPase/permease subunit
MAYLLYMQKITMTFGEMTGHLMTVSKVQGASYKVAELIVKETKLIMTENGIKDSTNEGRIDLKDVKFSYPSKPDVQVLKGVNIHC